jgi:hypothetical protein
MCNSIAAMKNDLPFLNELILVVADKFIFNLTIGVMKKIARTTTTQIHRPASGEAGKYERTSRHRSVPQPCPKLTGMPKRERVRELPESLPPFGRLIYTKRNQLGMTLNDVGILAGFKSGDYLSLIERGKRAPDLDRVPRLAEALRIEPKLLCEAWILQFHPLAAEALGIESTFEDVERTDSR